MSDYLDPENEELLKDFFLEAEMQVAVMERTVLAIESDPGDSDSIDELFRAAHTLKGGAYTVQMNELAMLTHKAEDLLDELRNGKLVMNPLIVDLLLSSIDVIKEMLEERTAGSTYTKDYSEIEKSLLAWLDGSAQAAQPKAVAPKTPQPESSGKSAATSNLPSPLTRAEYDDLCQQAGDKVTRLRVQFDESNPMNTIGAVQEFARLKDKGTIWITHPDFEELYEDNFFDYVDYYLESSEEEDKLANYAVLADVTLNIAAEPLDEDMVVDELAADNALPSSQVNQETQVSQGEQAANAPQDVKNSDVAPQKTPQKTAHGKGGKKEHENASVLRVDSRRVDDILNLVSEAVINKATFSQVSINLSDLAVELRSAHLASRDQLNRMIEDILTGSTIKEITSGGDETARSSLSRSVRKKLQDQAASVHSLFDPLEQKLKKIMGQFGHSAANLARNTSDLHESILGMRMVPVNQVFARFPRLVRDLSRSLDKKVELVLEGEETEIDKSVAEELVDPLMHCVRNAMDHGIENREARERSGKDEVGKLKLFAGNEGSNVIIEISDDGGGISLDSIRQKAIANGILLDGKLLSDQEAFNLIFDPGFSTAKEVTNISGRGVGLDVVKKQIEKLNGAVSVWSEPGRGSCFTIRLPLTLAIIQGLLVRVHSEIYAIPITAVAESIRITAEDIHLIDNYEVISVRDDVISLLRLNRIFQLEGSSEEVSPYMFVVVVGTEERRVGLMVDSLIGEEDVVSKPLVDRYTHSPGIAGATILGDGTVSLILDVTQLLDLGIHYERFMRERKSGL